MTTQHTGKRRRTKTRLLFFVGIPLLLLCHALHYLLLQFPWTFPQQQHTTLLNSNNNNSIFFDVLDSSHQSMSDKANPYSLRQGLVNDSSSQTCPSVCALRAGQGLEEDGGWKLLTEQIKIAPRDVKSNIRILCAIYTHAGQHDMVQTITQTWGKQCDGFLAFSTETHPSLGIVHLVHEGPEAYGNMWQKIRSIWGYLYENYRNDFDFFHLCGDDTYVIVPNLRQFLQNYSTFHGPLHFGQWIPHGNTVYTGGGPGYTLNQAALALFVEQASNCHVSTVASYEDRLLSMCLQQLNVYPSDTRDDKLRQLYHDVTPHSLYLATSQGRSFHARAMAFWESQSNTTFSKLQNASPYSIAFHDLFTPCYLERVHAILYPETCSSTSVLVQELRRYEHPTMF